MSFHLTDEERIVYWFTTADLASVETLFRVVRGIVRTRSAAPRRGRPPKNPDADTHQPKGSNPL